jgi:ABC-2 type transport system permease protein
MSSPVTDAPSSQPGPRAWAAMVAAEAKMVARDTAGLVVPIGLPMLFLVMNGLGASTEPLPGAGGMSAFDIYVLPLILVIGVATIGVVNMPSFLSYYRKSGVLRRLGVTPASPVMILVAQLVVSVLQTALGVALAVGVAVLGFGANLPDRWGAAIGVFALAAAAMYAVGLLVASIAPSPNAAVAIGLGAFFVLGAVGGMFGPATNLPDGIARVGELLPFGAAVIALGTAWLGEPPELRHLLALAGAIVVSGLLAARLFRWQ